MDVDERGLLRALCTVHLYSRKAAVEIRGNSGRAGCSCCLTPKSNRKMIDKISQPAELYPRKPASYYRARYYDSVAGRFINEDPIAFAAETNFYLYAENSPIGLKDPSGLDTYGWPIPGSSTPKPRPGAPPPRRKPYNCMAWGLGVTDNWMAPDDPFGPPGPYMRQHGCKEVPCDSVEPCGEKKQRHRVNTYEDPLRPWNWHVERQDCDGHWTSKNGQGPRVIGISNPDDYYQKIYGPVFNVKKTCWSCKGQ